MLSMSVLCKFFVPANDLILLFRLLNKVIKYLILELGWMILTTSIFN